MGKCENGKIMYNLLQYSPSPHPAPLSLSPLPSLIEMLNENVVKWFYSLWEHETL